MLSERLPLTEAPEELPEFVDGVLLPYLTPSESNRVVWCTQWRDHPDAVHRLAAIHEEWATMLGKEDASLHLFLRDVLDYHLPLLIDSEKGAFRRCGGSHDAGKQLGAGKRVQH